MKDLERKRGRKEGRKEGSFRGNTDPSVFQLNFHATKGWRTVVEKRKIDCSRMWPVLSNGNSECLGCFTFFSFFFFFFFFTRKNRNGVSTFSAIVLPFYKPMRATTETHRREGGGGEGRRQREARRDDDFTRYTTSTILLFAVIKHCSFIFSSFFLIETIEDV